MNILLLSLVFPGKHIQTQRLTDTILEEDVTADCDSSAEKNKAKLSGSSENSDSTFFPKFGSFLSCNNQDKPDSNLTDIKRTKSCDNSNLVDRKMFHKATRKESTAKDDDNDEFLVTDSSAIIGVEKPKSISSHQDKAHLQTPKTILADSLLPCDQANVSIASLDQPSVGCTLDKLRQECFQSQMPLEHSTPDKPLPFQCQLDFLKDTPNLSEQCPQQWNENSQLKEINVQTPKHSNLEDSRPVKEGYLSKEENM